MLKPAKGNSNLMTYSFTSASYIDQPSLRKIALIWLLLSKPQIDSAIIKTRYIHPFKSYMKFMHNWSSLNCDFEFFLQPTLSHYSRTRPSVMNRLASSKILRMIKNPLVWIDCEVKNNRCYLLFQKRVLTWLIKDDRPWYRKRLSDWDRSVGYW